MTAQFLAGLVIGLGLGARAALNFVQWRARRARQAMENSAKDYVSRYCAEMYLRHVTDVPRTWGAMLEQEVGPCRCGQCRAYEAAARKGLN